MTSIEFIYFDLGNVLLSFCHERMCSQMAQVAGVDAERVRSLLFDSDSQRRFETGELNRDAYFDYFCEGVGRRVDRAALELAASDIFDVRPTMTPLLAALEASGVRMAILSNTNETHWRFLAAGPFAEVVPGPFEFAVLSFEERSMKPNSKIFEAAIRRAGAPPERIFFMDDRPENVEGARRVGIDAVQFVDERQLAADLESRGVRVTP